MKNVEKGNKTLDLCEKLAGCPKGAKLWSPLFGECEFVGLSSETCHEPHDRVNVLCNVGDTYFFDKHGHYFSSSEECLLFPSRENRDWDNWECPKPKVERFDPKTLQPFDKILVRDDCEQLWQPAFFGEFDGNGGEKFPVVSIPEVCYRYAVPYNEDTKHLIATTDEAPEYYRWWEDK